MDDDQQFCLRWNNHQSTLISVFDTLLENGTLVDCTLAAEGKFLKAHKVVLSACSPYFATLLSQQYDKHPIFILKDVKFQELRAMMDYMYRGEVNISQDQLAALLKAAESLQIKGLSDSRGGSSTQKPTNEHKTLSVPVAGKGGSSTGYTLEQKRPRHTLDTQELSGSREGSSSPTSRKRKKIRRRSVDNVMADNHEHSNSSSHSMQVNSSIIPSSNTSAAIASISATAATSLSTSSTVAAISGTVGAVTGINVTKKTENMSNAKIGSIECENDDDDDDDNDDELDENDKQIGVVKKEQTKRKSHAESDPNKDGSDMLIEPKSEYDDGNDETVEDLTLDDEELLEDLDQAGPSHGGGEGSSQGYAQWQVDRSSQDEVFMAAQDAAGQQRDPQGDNSKTYSRIRVRNWLMLSDQANCAQEDTPEEPNPTVNTDPTNNKPPEEEEDDEPIDSSGAGVIVKIERNSPSLSIYNNNSNPSDHSPSFNYDLKISSPISWAFEPMKTENTVAVTDATAAIYTAVKKVRKAYSNQSTIGLRPKPMRILQNQVSHGAEKKYRILLQNHRVRKESLEHSADMIYNADIEKPWICRNCNRNYKWKNSLKCHLKNECGQPPKFFCNKMCGYRTNVHSNLKRHLNTKCKNKDDDRKSQ